MNIFTEVIGYMAALVGTFLMAPQLVRAMRTKHMGDVSVVMLWAYLVNCTLWSVYGTLLGALPMMICNYTAIVIAIWQLVLKRKYA
ncbi:hypothetical protein K8942_03840 [Candidatus Peribacteria bacterium]|nr:MAG: hypothetical protein K8942_03840 [Candidatus Peribacteria bacterium]